MKEKSQLDKPLKLMKLCLLLSGIKVYHKKWHPIIETLTNSCLFHFNLIILYTVIFGEIYWLVDGIQIGRNFVEMSLTAPCITISILSTLKAVPLYFKRDIVIQIIDILKDIHPKDTNEKNRAENHKQYIAGIKKSKDTGRLKQMQEKNSSGISMTWDNCNVEEKEMTVEVLAGDAETILKTVSTLLSGISVSVLITFLLAPLVSMYLGYNETGEMKITYPFSVKYWFDAYELKCWPLVYIHQTWATVIVCLNIFGTEVFFYSMCTYIEMHFRILCLWSESIPSGPSRETQEQLLEAVKKHQLLIDLVGKIEILFTHTSLVHIVSSSLLICLSAFNITVAEDIATVFAFVTFLLLTLSQVSLLCYFGDKLMRSSTEVSGAIYKCPWYEFDVNAKKVVLIIVMRAQKPCRLTAANFADLNLRAFTTILSRSWSYFALLKTVYN